MHLFLVALGILGVISLVVWLIGRYFEKTAID